MAETNTAARTARRRMTQAALIAEGLRRAATTDPFQIRFRCPACNRTQAAADLPPERALHVAQACFGCAGLAEEMTGDRRTALIRVTLPGGEKTDSFPLADEFDQDGPSAGHSGALGVLHGFGDAGPAIPPEGPSVAVPRLARRSSPDASASSGRPLPDGCTPPSDAAARKRTPATAARP